MSTEIKEKTNPENLNIHQKILKIAEAAGVLQRTKSGYNYKYVPEEEIQAKVTGAMQEYGVMLYNEIVPGTKDIREYSYEKVKYVLIKKETKETKAEYEKQVIPVNEIIVSADTIYTWVNADNPSEQIKVPWVVIGQMEDASQAFGAANTYCNRYFLMKSLQLATTEADPDLYRSKQQESADYEKTKVLAAMIKEVVDAGTKLITLNVTKDKMYSVVSKHNDGEKDPSTIKSVEVCEAILKEFKELQTKIEKENAEKSKAKPASNKEKTATNNEEKIESKEKK